MDDQTSQIINYHLLQYAPSSLSDVNEVRLDSDDQRLFVNAFQSLNNTGVKGELLIFHLFLHF